VGGYYAGEPVVIGEGVALEFRPAGIASRGLALLIDIAIQAGILIALIFIAAAASLHMNVGASAAIGLTLYVLLILGYPVGFETFANGRTPGKMALGLRVVRDDGGPIRFRHAFARGLVGVIVDRPGFSVALLSLIPMLVSSRSKRLGDMVAGTMVLQERVPQRATAPPMMPPPLAAWAAQVDLSGVNDDLALRMRQFLVRADQLSPWARDDMANRLVHEVTQRTAAPPPPGTPGWAYLSAVLAERRRRELARDWPVATNPPTAPGQPAPAPPSPAPAVEADPPPAPESGPFAPPG
jgi:uncharacterized RDD family membrane protein YckC